MYAWHDIDCVPAEPERFTEMERDLISRVPESLSRGIECKRWWEETHREDGYTHKFPLTRRFNAPHAAFGFFDALHIAGQRLHVMGSFDEETYDWTKTESAAARRDEFREFVLKYFLRVSDFRLPEVYAEQHKTAPDFIEPFSWCTKPIEARAGFGYSQLYGKESVTGKVFRFADDLRFAITDLRDIGTQVDWLVLKVSIFDFDLIFRPFGSAGPEMHFPLDEQTLVVLSRDFVSDKINPEAGIAGEFAFGYAILQQVEVGSLLAYGPGHFDFGFSHFLFRMLDSGEIRIRRVFVANRPRRLLNIPLNPLRLAERASGSLAGFTPSPSPFLGPEINIDPILGLITLANVLSFGFAGQLLCISREQLERQMLVQHFMQDYQMILGSLNTWRQTRNWQNSDALPNWVKSGVSS